MLAKVSTFHTFDEVIGTHSDAPPAAVSFELASRARSFELACHHVSACHPTSCEARVVLRGGSRWSQDAYGERADSWKRYSFWI